MLYGRYSLTPTNSASVELFVFNFCLDDLVCRVPCPRDIVPPVWLFMPGCIVWDASIQVQSMFKSRAPIIRSSSMVFSTKPQTPVSLLLSSLWLDLLLLCTSMKLLAQCLALHTYRYITTFGLLNETDLTLHLLDWWMLCRNWKVGRWLDLMACIHPDYFPNLWPSALVLSSLICTQRSLISIFMPRKSCLLPHDIVKFPKCLDIDSRTSVTTWGSLRLTLLSSM